MFKERSSKHWSEGKLLHFPFNPAQRRGHCGWYMGRITQVSQLKTGQIKTVTIAMMNLDTGNYDGRRIKLRPEEFRARYAGIKFQGIRVDIDGKELETVEPKRSTRSRS